jgi:hypothetical protein
VCTLGVALLAPLAVRLLSPAAYGHELLAQLAQVIALCALSQVIYLGASSVIFNEKRTSSLAITTPLAALVFVGTSILLVSSFGLVGMAIAKVIGFAALALGTVVAAGRLARIPWEAGKWVPVIAVAVLGVLALQLVPASDLAIWLQAGAAVVLGLFFIGRLARTGLPVHAPADS